MTSLLFAIAVFAAAATLTYFFCIRPMRRGQCGMAGTTDADHQRRQELESLRQEIDELRQRQTR
jgi:hypothetical protein